MNLRKNPTVFVNHTLVPIGLLLLESLLISARIRLQRTHAIDCSTVKAPFSQSTTEFSALDGL